MARRAAVVPVLILPFVWEGSRRERGLVLAERFVRAFGRATLMVVQATTHGTVCIPLSVGAGTSRCDWDENEATNLLNRPVGAGKH